MIELMFKGWAIYTLIMLGTLAVAIAFSNW
jgi:hypothetical protein